MRKLVIAMILTVLMAQTAGLPTFAHLTPPPCHIHIPGHDNGFAPESHEIPAPHCP